MLTVHVRVLWSSVLVAREFLTVQLGTLTGIPGKEERFPDPSVLTAVYGLVNTPAVWWKTVWRVLGELGYLDSTSLTPACITRPTS